jgi:hypothetical protein
MKTLSCIEGGVSLTTPKFEATSNEFGGIAMEGMKW